MGEGADLSEALGKKGGFCLHCVQTDGLSLQISCPCDLSAGLLRGATGGRASLLFNIGKESTG